MLSAGAIRFATRFDVSRETLERLSRFSDLLVRWNSRINLISPASVPHLWTRHLIDCAQIWMLLPRSGGRLMDFGTGAGLPGLVIAILDTEGALDIHLVESDSRKCAFLATVQRELSLDVTIHRQRIETISLPPADVITARALAPLADLLAYTWQHRAPNGTAYFPKGRSFQKELDEAHRLWNFEYTLHPSITDPASAVVEIGAIDGPVQTDNSCPR